MTFTKETTRNVFLCHTEKVDEILCTRLYLDMQSLNDVHKSKCSSAVPQNIHLQFIITMHWRNGTFSFFGVFEIPTFTTLYPLDTKATSGTVSATDTNQDLENNVAPRIVIANSISSRSVMNHQMIMCSHEKKTATKLNIFGSPSPTVGGGNPAPADR